MLCREESVVAEDQHGGIATALRCRSWNCDTCAPERKRQVIANAMAGAPERFITLTTHRRQGKTPELAAQELVNAWRILLKRWRRQKQSNKADYFAVFEATKRGWPHLHILFRGPRISQSWLSEGMRELTGSPIVDIRRIQDGRSAARYVGKYVGKAPGKFGTLKRYWQTPKWRLEAHTVARRVFLRPVTWRRSMLNLNDLAIFWTEAGRVIEADGWSVIKWGLPP